MKLKFSLLIFIIFNLFVAQVFCGDDDDGEQQALNPDSGNSDDCEGEDMIVANLNKHLETPTSCLKLMEETTFYVDNLLTKNEIVYWAMKGTMLGAVREHGIIRHDYDIDLGMLEQDINKVAALRDQIWSDGYILFQAPWPGYNNMQFVIMKKVKSVRNYYANNPYPSSGVPIFSKEVRKLGVSAELMAFTNCGTYLAQVICTQPQDADHPYLYSLTNAPTYDDEFNQDIQAFDAAGKKVDGWLKYADSDDKPFLAFNAKFDQNHMSPYCQRTAPASFRYDCPANIVLPPKRVDYLSGTIAVPHDPDAFAKRYFGDDYLVPKRRYG